MLPILYFILILITGCFAGAVGAVSGLGGGVLLIPALTILFGVPIQYAAGASLIATIATSSGAASSYVKDRLSNIKIGMSLEIATTLGAIAGALVAGLIYAHGLGSLIFIIFGIVLLLSLYPALMQFKKNRLKPQNRDWTTKTFQLSGSYYDEASRKTVHYSGYRWWLGEIVMGFAGIISGLLGIGSGVLKVIGMDWGMKLPMKVTTATSDFMIGVTAAAGSAIYWSFGYIQPFLAAPIVVGVLMGAFAGSKLLEKSASRKIRMFFLVVLAVVALEMVLRGLGVA